MRQPILLLLSVLASAGLIAQTPLVPAEYQDLYSEMTTTLARVDGVIESSWDRSEYTTVFGAGLAGAHAQLGPQLLESNHYEGVLYELDGLKALGVKGVTLSIGFPMLYRPFFSSDAEYSQYLDFYVRLAGDIRARGLKLIVESQVVFAGGGGGAWDLRSYYDGLTLAEYQNGRMEVARTIARDLKPDYLSVITEPDTEAAQSGQAALAAVDGSTDLLRVILGGLQGPEADGVKLGAGVGTWIPTYAEHVQSFASTNIDFIDMHVYPGNLSFLDRIMEIADIARANGKAVGMSETWPYKIRDSELGRVGADRIFARDHFSFWAPVDSRHLQTMVKLAHFKQLDFLSAFWSGYFRAYQEYSPAAAALPGYALQAISAYLQQKAVLNGEFTSTGLAYEDALVSPRDVTPPAPPLGLQATVASESSIYLKWEPADDNVGAAGYRLYRDGLEISNGAHRYFLDSDLADGKTFNYTVAAFDAHGNLSGPSAAVPASTPDMTPPTRPAGLVADAMSETQVDLSWTPSEDNVGVTGYIVYRGPTVLQMSAIAFSETPSHSDTLVWFDRTYLYAVEAVDTSGRRSDRSAIVSVTTPADTAPPQVVQDLIAQTVSDQQINLAWTPSSDNVAVYGYKIFRGISPANLYLIAFTRGSSYASNGLRASTTYYYSVEAVDVAGNGSGPSALASAVTNAPAGP